MKYRRSSAGIAVHPHTRGEHAISTQCHRARSGSSPHARGTRRGVGEKESVIRFIPTRAGNTRLQDSVAVTNAVHPHTRGEHLARNQGRRRAVGSSPHARGTRNSRHRARAGGRFIPTRAGNTSTGWRWRRRPAVHPHTRGEHHVSMWQSTAPAGSSPHARGTHSIERDYADVYRFIPTRAGNTPQSRMRPSI